VLGISIIGLCSTSSFYTTKVGVVFRQLIIPVVVVVVVVFACDARRGGAQSSMKPSSKEALAEAERLSIEVEELDKQGKFAEAVPLAERSLSLRETELGRMHLDVAASLHRLGDLHVKLGEYDKALPLLARALDIREKAPGRSDPDVAATLDILAGLHFEQGAYVNAESLLVRALDIREKALGRTHPDLAKTLTKLAELHLEQGAYAKVEPLLVRALTIREKASGPMHPTVAEALSDLAGLYRELGDYAKAAPLFVRALDINEKALGPLHPDVAYSLNNLGTLFSELGAYAKAEPLLVRALDIRERALGPIHPRVATSLNNLALLYETLGAYETAGPLYLRALGIWENALGSTHPNVASSLSNLAALYRRQGMPEKAEPLHRRALDIDEKVHGPVHPNVADDLSKLAALYADQGAYDKAEPVYRRALEIWEKTVGPMSPKVATCLGSIAALYTDQGAYEMAEPLYRRALSIDENVWGTIHPDVATNLNGLARLYRAQGAYNKAQPLLSRAVEIREAQLRAELARLSEPRRRALMTTLRDETGSVVSLHVDAMPTSAGALDLALTTVLRRKGRLLDSLAETQATLRSHLTPALRAQLDQLAQARAALARLVYGPGDRAAEIAVSRGRVESVEAALATASLEFRVQSAPITMTTVQAALPRGAMLVEFVRYRRFAAGRVQQRLQPDRYVAYLVTRQGRPQWVALGDAAPIDAAIDSALAVLRTLDELVLAPIRPRLTDVSQLILAPDSKLNLVPFEALVDPQGHYEVEQRLMSYVASGRDLLRLAAPRAPRSPAVIVASPDYGPSPSPDVPGTVLFTPLPGARGEVDELRRFFSTAPLTGAEATKHALAELRGPAILHVATHGFYTRDAAGMRTPPVPASGTAGASSTPLAQRSLRLSAGSSPQSPPDDPLDGLDQAGLAMAGANQGPDGIVTAREIAGFDWWGTKLVVLSACETGVGAVPSGDGVYGLRRAVVLAGAEAQVVSLWNVNDSSARELMREFYGELARGTGRAEALRQAKLRLLRQTRYSHPHYWAAFILAGDWTALEKRVFQPATSTP
jgi:CHAT domain-containing protein/tetratricopeptide (TPR) repeat protein